MVVSTGPAIESVDPKNRRISALLRSPHPAESRNHMAGSARFRFGGGMAGHRRPGPFPATSHLCGIVYFQLVFHPTRTGVAVLNWHGLHPPPPCPRETCVVPATQNAWRSLIFRNLNPVSGNKAGSRSNGSRHSRTCVRTPVYRNKADFSLGRFATVNTPPEDRGIIQDTNRNTGAPNAVEKGPLNENIFAFNFCI